ncbi:O-acyltransferase, WSD1, C-terminal [Artemisia annua]|uniref:O-acyltransferase, WSD1, C-terminal n=1 Tax=Artemisia annua TaxID=35608 RepID=A0A2U1QFP9_ARTAN|nr:O-acyltransferase, WSD1, C-terminal [Artemisia annua]
MKTVWDVHLLNLKTLDAEAIGIFHIHHPLVNGTSLMSLLLACTRQISNPDLVHSVLSHKDGNSGWFSSYSYYAPTIVSKQSTNIVQKYASDFITSLYFHVVIIEEWSKQYTEEYQAQQKELIQLECEARLKGGFYVYPEAKMLFIIRIRVEEWTGCLEITLKAVPKFEAKHPMLFRLKFLNYFTVADGV